VGTIPCLSFSWLRSQPSHDNINIIDCAWCHPELGTKRYLYATMYVMKIRVRKMSSSMSSICFLFEQIEYKYVFYLFKNVFYLFVSYLFCEFSILVYHLAQGG